MALGAVKQVKKNTTKALAKPRKRIKTEEDVRVKFSDNGGGTVLAIGAPRHYDVDKGEILGRTDQNKDEP